MKVNFLILIAAGLVVGPFLSSLNAGTITAEVRVVGKIFNGTTRQHLQANYRGHGIHQPSGDVGTVNGGATSLRGQRVPTSTSVLGSYNVNVRVQARADGSSYSRQIVTTVRVRPTRIVVAGIGRINLSRRIRPTKAVNRIYGRGKIKVRVPF